MNDTIGRLLLVVLVAAALLFGVSLSFVSVEWTPFLLGTGGVVAAVLAAASPAFFVFATMFVASQGFGIADLKGELLSGVPISDALFAGLFACSILGGLWRSRHHKGDLRRTQYSNFTWLVCLALVGFLAITEVRWHQGIWLGIKAAKPSLFFVLALFGGFTALDVREQRRCIWALLIAGLISAATTIVGCFVLLEPYLPAISVRSYSMGFHRTFNQAYSITFLAFFIALFDRETLKPAWRGSIMFVTGLATLILGTRAFWIGIIVALLWFFFRHRDELQIGQYVVRFVPVAVLVVGALFVLDVQGLVTERVTIIHEDLSRPAGSLGIRVEVIRRLLSLFYTSPVLGAGFAHPDAVGGRLGRTVGLDSVFTIDVGWIDILMRVGLLGVVTFAWLFFRLCRDLHGESSPTVRGAATALRAFLIMGFAALPGAALFTWIGGVVPIALCLGIVDGGHRWARRTAPAAARPMHEPAPVPVTNPA